MILLIVGVILYLFFVILFIRIFSYQCILGLEGHYQLSILSILAGLFFPIVILYALLKTLFSFQEGQI